jgi:hypothetical protein
VIDDDEQSAAFEKLLAAIGQKPYGPETPHGREMN